MKKLFLLFTLTLASHAATLHTVNLGSAPSGTGGDTARVAFQKVGSNDVILAAEITTASNGLASLGSLHMSKAFQTHKYLQSPSGPLKWGCLGDSVGDDVYEHAAAYLALKLGTNGFAAPFGSQFIYSDIGNPTNISVFGTANVTNFWRDYTHLGVNDAREFYDNGNGEIQNVNRFAVAYLSGPSMGTFALQYKTNGGAWTTALTVDSARAAGWRGAVTNIDVLTGNYRFRVTNTIGWHKHLFGMAWKTNGTGLRLTTLALSSISFEDVMSAPTNHVWPITQSLGLHALLIEEKSSAQNQSTNLNLLRPWLSNAFPNCDYIFLETPPDAAGNAGPQNLVTRGWALTNNFPFAALGSQLFASYATMTNFFGADDGTHPVSAVGYNRALRLLNDLGVPTAIYGTREVGVGTLAYAQTNAANAWTGDQSVAGGIRSMGSGAELILNRRTGSGGTDSASVFLEGTSTSAQALRTRLTGAGGEYWLTNNGVGEVSLVPSFGFANLFDLGLDGQRFRHGFFSGNVTASNVVADNILTDAIVTGSYIGSNRLFAAASLVWADGTWANKHTQTNRVTANFDLTFTNYSSAQEMRVILSGEASGGANRTVTIRAVPGDLIQVDGAAFATSVTLTITNGQKLILHEDTYPFQSTNILDIVTERGAK